MQGDQVIPANEKIDLTRTTDPSSRIKHREMHDDKEVIFEFIDLRALNPAQAVFQGQRVKGKMIGQIINVIDGGSFNIDPGHFAIFYFFETHDPLLFQIMARLLGAVNFAKNRPVRQQNSIHFSTKQKKPVSTSPASLNSVPNP
jgi:hypothetical protein